MPQGVFLPSLSYPSQLVFLCYPRYHTPRDNNNYHSQQQNRLPQCEIRVDRYRLIKNPRKPLGVVLLYYSIKRGCRSSQPSDLHFGQLLSHWKLATGLRVLPIESQAKRFPFIRFMLCCYPPGPDSASLLDTD